jgi:glycosyltransferase involved in cell wall biosynthesis
VTSFSISVPIGAYHRLLPTCLESLARQSADLQVSLLDASGDSRVSDLADRYSGILAYRRHGPDKGQSDAIIEGWLNTQSDVLGWLNADDFLFPKALERAAALFDQHPEVDVVSGHSAICDRDGRMTGYHWAVAPPGEALRLGCVISQPSCFFKRGACDAIGGLDQSLHYTMDWDLWLRLLQNGAEFAFLPEILSVVYWGEGTKTAGWNSRRRRELERLISNYTPADKRFRVRRGYALRAWLDGVRPAPLKVLLETFLRRNPPAIFGVGPNGSLANMVTIEWCHFDEAPRQSLRIRLDGDPDFSISSDRKLAGVQAAGSEILVDFEDPVGCAQTVIVTMEKKGAGRSRLVSVDWA